MMLSNDELIARCRTWIQRMCDGDHWLMRIPADEEGDPDMLFAEALNRLAAALAAKESAEAQPCRAREAVTQACEMARELSGRKIIYGSDVLKIYDKCYSQSTLFAGVRMDPAPCEHAAELAIARETIAGQEVEIREGDYWQERARQSFANGTCPCCFCTDEGPHKEGCAWEEHAAELARVEEVLKFLSSNSVEIVPRKDGSVELYVDRISSSDEEENHVFAPTLLDAVDKLRRLSAK